MDAKAAARLVSAMSAQRAPAFKSDLRVVTTPDAGHYPAIDQPSTVLRQLAANPWLQRAHRKQHLHRQQRVAQPLRHRRPLHPQVTLQRVMQQGPLAIHPLGRLLQLLRLPLAQLHPARWSS